MSTTNESFLQETLQFWQTRTKRVLTLEDAREIAENIGAFFEILLSTPPSEREQNELAVKP